MNLRASAGASSESGSRQLAGELDEHSNVAGLVVGSWIVISVETPFGPEVRVWTAGRRGLGQI
jgi:hypothetical protein